MKVDFKFIFDKVIAIVFSLMLLFLTLSIIIGVFHLFFILGEMVMHKELARDYLKIISDVLTLFILIELSRSLVEYFNTNRLRLTFIVDAAIVFVLRELMIQMFEHKIMPDEIYALSALLFVLGAIRIGSVLVYQREKRCWRSANLTRSDSLIKKYEVLRLHFLKENPCLLSLCIGIADLSICFWCWFGVLTGFIR